MSYDPPKGRELQAVRKIRKLAGDINNAQSRLTLLTSCVLNDPYDNSENAIGTWGITSRFALDGVRTNAVDRLTSIANFIVGVRRIRKRQPGLLREIHRELCKLDRLLQQIERVIAPFKLCVSCKGAKGKYIPRQEKQSIIKRWQDCASCDGRGVER